MKLTHFIIDIGRPVAYYPSLKKITFSTTASILLCQFLYWSDKTDDGWFYKTAEELEEETGLSYAEQKTARDKLTELNLVEEKYHRLDHQLCFKVNQEVLNERWEMTGGKKPKPIVKQPEKVAVKAEPAVVKAEPVKQEKPPKKDFLDLIKDQKEWPGFKQGEIKIIIAEKIKTRLRLNPDGKRWQTLIDYASDRELNHKEPFDKFIDWLLTTDNYNPQYWSPERMMTMYPQAFIKKESPDKNSGFVINLPQVVKEEYVPMPTGLGKKLKE